jgi:hypothetical protein
MAVFMNNFSFSLHQSLIVGKATQPCRAYPPLTNGHPRAHEYLPHSEALICGCAFFDPPPGAPNSTA